MPQEKLCHFFRAIVSSPLKGKANSVDLVGALVPFCNCFIPIEIGFGPFLCAPKVGGTACSQLEHVPNLNNLLHVNCAGHVRAVLGC